MASNDGYVPYMGVSLFSMLENNKKDFNRIHIYIIDNGISEENRGKLLKFYLITAPKRWMLAKTAVFLGTERYDKICGFYQEHWDIPRVLRVREKRKDLDVF